MRKSFKAYITGLRVTDSTAALRRKLELTILVVGATYEELKEVMARQLDLSVETATDEEPQGTPPTAPIPLYKVGIGSYSDYWEQWWTHAKRFTQEEFNALLLTTWREVTRPRLKKAEEAWEAKFVERFPSERLDGATQGTVDEYRQLVKSGDEIFKDSYSEVLRDAGFTELTPDAHWNTEHVTPGYSHLPNETVEHILGLTQPRVPLNED